MTETLVIRGVVPVVPTPFHPDESIDSESFRKVVDWIAGSNLAGMCLPAYGSEFYKLSDIERDELVAAAIEVCDGRVPVIAQANHTSTRLASQLARRYEAMGADAVSVAIPRQFGASTYDILKHCETIASAVSCPVLVQDFNPGGSAIDAEFVVELSNRCDNFQFVKFEDPMMVDKILSIRDQLDGRVAILEGWGGLYMLEGISAGIVGVMPGAAIADLLGKVFSIADSGDSVAAYELFGSLLPFMNFMFQDFETFLWIEKRTLVRRGLIKSETVRALARTPSSSVVAHVDHLIDQIERIRVSQNLGQ